VGARFFVSGYPHTLPCQMLNQTLSPQTSEIYFVP
jgi:hypothetical protein